MLGFIILFSIGLIIGVVGYLVVRHLIIKRKLKKKEDKAE